MNDVYKQLHDISQISGATQEKIKIIESFPIPNTKEDITEFIILASSNIDSTALAGVNFGGSLQEHYNTVELSKAWKHKLDQAYQKAKISFSDDSDFYRIQSIYKEKKKRNIHKKIFATNHAYWIFCFFFINTWNSMDCYVICI